MSIPHFKRITVTDGADIFYREAGTIGKPTLVLLHGFPHSSFYFRNLIPILAGAFHIIAPDLPGFGFTKVPAGYTYTFANLSKTIGELVDALGLEKFSLYIHDYGAPVGLRLALKIPEKIEAIVSQNGNAYEVGLGGAWAGVQAYWKDPSAENRALVRGAVLGLEGIKALYLMGAPDPNLVAPETYTLDNALTSGSNAEIQLDLFLDYQTNVILYPEFQAYLRKYQPRLLAVWGDKDIFFIPPGAEAFKQDVPSAEIHFLNAGHFALETHVIEIGQHILKFFGYA